MYGPAREGERQGGHKGFNGTEVVSGNAGCNKCHALFVWTETRDKKFHIEWGW